MPSATRPSASRVEGPPPAASPARPRWHRIVVAGGAVVILVVAVVAAVLGRDVVAPLVPGGQSCRVGSGADRVRLDPGQAVAATRLVAARQRAGASLASTRSALARSLDLSSDDAGRVARALTGRVRAGLTCSYDADTSPSSRRLDAAGLTPRAAAVRRDLDATFGRLPKGGFAPGGVRTGHQAGSAHYEGRAIDVFFRPIDAAHQRRGWTLATYLVAHAERLHVATVIYDDRIWTTWRSGEGWRRYDVDTSGRSPATAAILEHRDHVHVDVFR